MNSPLVRRLVEEQIALRSEIAQLSATLLPQHPRMVELQGQITDLGRQVANEAGKILVSLQAQADVALSRENEINRELELLADAAPTASTDEVDLGTLEREAEAARDLLDSYMRRYRDVLAGRADRGSCRRCTDHFACRGVAQPGVSEESAAHNRRSGHADGVGACPGPGEGTCQRSLVASGHGAGHAIARPPMRYRSAAIRAGPTITVPGT